MYAQSPHQFNEYFLFIVHHTIFLIFHWGGSVTVHVCMAMCTDSYQCVAKDAWDKLRLYAKYYVPAYTARLYIVSCIIIFWCTCWCVQGIIFLSLSLYLLPSHSISLSRVHVRMRVCGFACISVSVCMRAKNAMYTIPLCYSFCSVPFSQSASANQPVGQRKHRKITQLSMV